MLGSSAAKPQWFAGLLVGFVFFVPLLVGSLIDQSALAPTAAIVAVFLIVAAPSNTWFSRRVVGLLVGWICMVGIVFVAGYASRTTLSAALVIAVLGFASPFMGQLKPTGAVFATILVPLGFTFLAIPTTNSIEVLHLVLAGAIGGLWAIVVFVVATRLRRELLLRDAVAEVFSCLARYVLDPSTTRRVEFDETFDLAVEASSEPLVMSSETANRLGETRRLLAQAKIIQVEVESSSGNGVSPDQSEADWPIEVALALREQRDVPWAPQESAESEIKTILDSTWQAKAFGSIVRHNLDWKSPVMREGARYAIALFVAGLIAGVSGIAEGWWVVLTVAVVLKGGLDETVSVIWRRLLGTLVGVALAAILVTLLQHRVIPAIIVTSILLAVAIGVQKINYAYWVALVTPVVVVLVSQASSGSVLELAAWRVLDTFIGLAVVIAASYLLWPQRSTDSEQVTC